MSYPTIAAGVSLWQDGRTVTEKMIRSLEGAVEWILLADGRVQGVPDLGLPDTTDLEWVREVARCPVVYRQQLWPDHNAQLGWQLETARELGADWVLFLSADEELRWGGLLRRFLDGCPHDHWPIPFYYGLKTKPEDASLCPSKCLRVDRWQRPVAGSNAFLHADGTIYRVPEGASEDMLEDAWYLLALEQIPYLDHHPELREPEKRRKLRYVDYEMDQLPIPYDESELWPEMTLTPHPLLDGARRSYRCDQCGGVYRNRGMCRGAFGKHPPYPLTAQESPLYSAA